MKQIVSVIFLLVPSIIAYSQQNDKNDDLWASPSVEGMNLSKGIVFSYRRLSPYDIKSESQVPELLNDAEGDIQRIKTFLFKLRVPVLLKEQTQLIVGLQYRLDEFEFKDPENINYVFYNELHHKPLRGRGLRFYFNHSMDEKKYIFSRIGIELNGDISDDWYTSLKYSLSATYGWKIDYTKSWGVGFYFSYTFGRPLLLPAILYNKTWNKHLGIESLFPGLVQLRYRINDKNLLFAGYDVDGASYNMDLNNVLGNRFTNIQLRRSEVTPFIRYEGEVYDFIWLSVSGGLTYNLNFNVSEDNIFNEKEIITNDVQSGLFFEGSIFIVPSESLKKLLKKEEPEFEKED